MRSFVCPILANIVLLGLVAGCMSQNLKPDSGKLQWHAIQYEQGSWKPNKRSEPEDLKRAMRFFGPTTNHWAKTLLPTYERLLSRIHEPSLFMARTNIAAREYRLLYLPAWSSPVVIRIHQSLHGSSLRIHAWSQPNSAGDRFGPFVAEKRCDDLLWKQLTEQLRALGFWERTSHRDEPEGLDGYRFVLEGLDRGTYHLVDRYGADDPEFEEICLALLKQAPVEAKRYFWAIDDATQEELAAKRASEANE
jgi:hypothetical protein